MIKIIAGIGSRQTPESIMAEMTRIGTWCKLNKILVRSGHAEGADWAFEQGAQDSCIAFVPWAGFNSQLTSKAKQWTPEYTDELMKTVDQFHPTPERLSPAVRKIMARNACQILGKDSLSDMTQAVVCWTKNASEDGGTAQAIKIAKYHNVPVYNMALTEYNNADIMIKILQKL
jgi:hypothetical protein